MLSIFPPKILSHTSCHPFNSHICLAIKTEKVNGKNFIILCNVKNNPKLINLPLECRAIKYVCNYQNIQVTKGCSSFRNVFWYLQFSNKMNKKKFDFTTIVPPQVFLYLFWENLRHQKDISKLTYLYPEILKVILCNRYSYYYLVQMREKRVWGRSRV